jgi:hypothetical protein
MVKMNKTKKCKNQATMHGLNKWYVSMFEKLGWMVLAKNLGNMEYKINAYKESLNRIEEKIECKIDTIKEMDRKNDLYIMLKNVRILKEHAMKDL